MPRQKYDEYGCINRTYMIKCPECNELIYITFEDDHCPHCKAWICPDCLHSLHKDDIYTDEMHTVNGGSLTITCKHCGYDVVDTDLML